MAPGSPSRWNPNPMQPWIDMEIEADMERARWMQPGVRIRWLRLPGISLPREAEVYVGWTIRF